MTERVSDERLMGMIKFPNRYDQTADVRTDLALDLRDCRAEHDAMALAALNAERVLERSAGEWWRLAENGPWRKTDGRADKARVLATDAEAALARIRAAKERKL